MENIDIRGIEFLSENEKADVQKIVANSYEKIKRKTKVDFVLKLVIKAHSKGELAENKDKRKHYSIKATISGTVRAFEAGADDWELHKTLHMALDKLETEVEHTFHSSEQH